MWKLKNTLMHLNYYLVILCLQASSCFAQQYYLERPNEYNNNITWCTTSIEEQHKCQSLMIAVERDRSAFGSDYKAVSCKFATNKDECMYLIDREQADITLLDAGEVFIGGRYSSLVPIVQEIYAGNENFFFSVAVIKRNTLPDVYSLRDLRGKRACFPGVGTLAGWVIPVYMLMKHGGMEIVDCNNHVKSAINYFGSSCAVNSLNDKYNPIGDNSDKLCDLCIGKVPGEKCTTSDPYYGFEGAFRCLVEAGDIAFLRHTTVLELTRSRPEYGGMTPDKFQLICRDGTRREIGDYMNCNWGSVPSHAIVTSSAKSGDQRREMQRFLKGLVKFYGKQFGSDGSSNINSNNNIPDSGIRFKRDNRTKRQVYDPFSNTFNGNQLDPYSSNQPAQFESFKLFDSTFYGKKFNLLVQDASIDLRSLEEDKQTYTGYLSESMDVILGVRDCPVNRMTLCVTSEPELAKCVKMKTALKAQLLKPDMTCLKAHSQINCMQSIRNGLADVTVLDAGDIYTAGRYYDLIPFISEAYNLGKPEYYVVAVAKEEDPSTELTYLKGKYTCHTGINTAAGWIVPLALMISNGWIRSYGCNSIRAAAEYFSKSCVPGAISTEYNYGVPYDNMCDLCHGASYRYCRRDASEDYYGHTGALKCLVEGGGQVAFVKHTTVLENTDGKRRTWWARNRLRGDFELLCPDGKRAQMDEYERCALGVVKANAIVTRGGYGYNETELKAFINLFVYAQQYYGRKDQDDFSYAMYYSPEPYSDLIFQDATQQLMTIPPYERDYRRYLGKDFLRAKRIVDCRAGADSASYSFAALIGTIILSTLLLCPL